MKSVLHSRPNGLSRKLIQRIFGTALLLGLSLAIAVTYLALKSKA